LSLLSFSYLFCYAALYYLQLFNLFNIYQIYKNFKCTFFQRINYIFFYEFSSINFTKYKYQFYNIKLKNINFYLNKNKYSQTNTYSTPFSCNPFICVVLYPLKLINLYISFCGKKKKWCSTATTCIWCIVGDLCKLTLRCD